MLLHRWRESVRDCCDHGPAAAPWPEKLRRGRWRPGRCRGWSQRPRSGRTPRGSCSEKPRQQEETSAGDAMPSHCATPLNAPEMRKPTAAPEPNKTGYQGTFLKIKTCSQHEDHLQLDHTKTGLVRNTQIKYYVQFLGVLGSFQAHPLFLTVYSM